MHEFFEKFAINTKVNEVWGEMDALGHVNNVSYFRYFETARIDFLSKRAYCLYCQNPAIALFCVILTRNTNGQ